MSKYDIRFLIDKSDNCYQTLTFHCFSSKLSQFASWKGINGQFHQYFTNSKENICECSKNNSCTKIGNIHLHCNCDHGDPVQRQDLIIIRKKVKNRLPSFAKFLILHIRQLELYNLV